MTEHDVIILRRTERATNAIGERIYIHHIGVLGVAFHYASNAVGPEEKEACSNLTWLATTGAPELLPVTRVLDGITFHITNGIPPHSSGGPTWHVQHHPTDPAWIRGYTLSDCLHALALRAKDQGDYDKQETYTELYDLIAGNKQETVFHNGNRLRVRIDTEHTP